MINYEQRKIKNFFGVVTLGVMCWVIVFYQPRSVIIDSEGQNDADEVAQARLCDPFLAMTVRKNQTYTTIFTIAILTVYLNFYEYLIRHLSRNLKLIQWPLKQVEINSFFSKQRLLLQVLLQLLRQLLLRLAKKQRNKVVRETILILQQRTLMVVLQSLVKMHVWKKKSVNISYISRTLKEVSANF